MYMKQNIKSSVIDKLEIIEKDKECKSNYQPLKLGNWSGTYEGCKSPMNNEVFITDDFINICNPYAGDTIYHQNEEQPFYIWKRYKFCAKKIEAFFQTEKCDIEGQMKCGDFCVEFGDNCPITDLKIAHSQDTDYQELQNNKDYKEIFDKEFKVFISRNIQKLPLNGFNIFKGDAQCFIPLIVVDQVYKLSSDILLKQYINSTFCGKYGGEYFYLDRQQELEVYKQNNIYDLIKDIPLVNDDIIRKNAYLRLAQDRKIKFASDQCSSVMSFQIIDPINNNQPQYRDYFNDANWTLFICSIIQIFISIFSIIAWQIKQNFEILIDPFQLENFQPLLIGFTINYFCFTFPIFIVYVGFLNRVKEYYDQDLATIQRLNSENPNCFLNSIAGTQIQEDIKNNIMMNYFEDFLDLGYRVIIISSCVVVINGYLMIMVRKLKQDWKNKKKS